MDHEWVKPAQCDSASCVEVAEMPDGSAMVRHSKAGERGPVLTFTPDEWSAFIGAVRAGQYGTHLEATA